MQLVAVRASIFRCRKSSACSKVRENDEEVVEAMLKI
jgi:hypothetical protein